jgi:copper chaperone CopZ
VETLTLSISGMTCGHCVASVRRALETVPGVAVENVRIGSAELRLSGTETAATKSAALAAVQDAGYDASVAGASRSAATPRTTAGCGCGCGAPADLTSLTARAST